MRRAALYLLAMGALTAPMDAVRLGGFGSIADGFLLAAIGVIALRTVSRGLIASAGAIWTVSVLALTFGLIALIGGADSELWGEHVANAARWGVAAAILPATVAALNPNLREIRVLSWAYVAGAASSASVAFGDPGRAIGLSQHPNALGAASMLAFFVVLGLSANRHAHRWERLVALGVGAALAVGVLDSGSRAAFIGLAAGAALFVMGARSKRLLVGAGVVAGCGALLISMSVWAPHDGSAVGRLLDRDGTATLADIERSEYRDTVARRITEQPFFGSGFSDASRAHSLPLQAADAGGMFGALIFLVLFATIGWRLWQTRWQPLGLGFLAAFASYLVAGLASNPMWDRWIWVPIALGLVHSQLHSGPDESSGRHASQLAHAPNAQSAR